METPAAQIQLANIGRYMMDCAVTEKCCEKSNELARLGDMLTRFNATWGTRAKDFSDNDLRLINEYMQKMV